MTDRHDASEAGRPASGVVDYVIVGVAALSLLTYLATSQGVRNHVLFLIEAAGKILSRVG